MFNCFIVCFVVILGSSLSVRAEDTPLIGDALEVGNPCGNYAITVERLIGGPPNRESYWDGRMNLQNFRNLSEAVITLFLSGPAAVTVDEKDGKLLTDSNPFNITFFKSKEDTFNAKFHVRSLSKEDYPILSGLLLNGEDICPNLQESSQGPYEGHIDHESNIIGEGDSKTNTECGQRYFNANEDEDWLWFVAIYQNVSNVSTFKCGGAYIAPQFVITTGRCLTYDGNFLEPENLIVEMSNLKDKAENYSVNSIKIHENFTYLDDSSDIAIMQININTSVSSLIPAICFWRSNFLKSLDDESDTSPMFLITKNHESKDLIRSRVSLASVDECSENNENPVVDNICGKFDEELEICEKDNGSGLFIERDNTHILRGLLSSVGVQGEKQVCSSRNRSTFVDLSDFSDWISDNI